MRSGCKHPYQCGHRHCRQRYAFAKPLEAYRRKPEGLVSVNGAWLCGQCGKGHLNPTRKYIDAMRKREGLCDCDGLHHRHRPGTKGCLQGRDNIDDHGLDPWGLAAATTVSTDPPF